MLTLLKGIREANKTVYLDFWILRLCKCRLQAWRCVSLPFVDWVLSGFVRWFLEGQWWCCAFSWMRVGEGWFCFSVSFARGLGVTAGVGKFGLISGITAAGMNFPATFFTPHKAHWYRKYNRIELNNEKYFSFIAGEVMHPLMCTGYSASSTTRKI